jgi:hypothetical protein
MFMIHARHQTDEPAAAGAADDVAARRADGRFWSPYLRSLPEAYDTPLYFHAEDAALLDGTNLGSSLPGIKAGLRERYDALFPPLRFLPKNHSFFNWCFLQFG